MFKILIVCAHMTIERERERGTAGKFIRHISAVTIKHQQCYDWKHHTPLNILENILTGAKRAVKPGTIAPTMGRQCTL